MYQTHQFIYIFMRCEPQKQSVHYGPQKILYFSI